MSVFEVNWPSHYTGIMVGGAMPEDIEHHVAGMDLEEYRRVKEITLGYQAAGTEVTQVYVQIGAGGVQMSFEEFERAYGIGE